MINCADPFEPRGAPESVPATHGGFVPDGPEQGGFVGSGWPPDSGRALGRLRSWRWWVSASVWKAQSAFLRAGVLPMNSGQRAGSRLPLPPALRALRHHLVGLVRFMATAIAVAVRYRHRLLETPH